MNFGKKLKRGLKDISPLFGAPEEVPPHVAPQRETLHCEGIHTLSVFDPHDSRRSFKLNAFLASQLQALTRQAALISITSNVAGREEKIPLRWQHPEICPVRTLRVAWDRFEEVCSRPVIQGGLTPGMSQVILMDVDYMRLPRVEKVFPVLDDLILVVRPETDSLMEAFRFIKAAQSVQHRMEYGLIFEGDGNDARLPFIFERFSALLSRHLGIQPVFLGAWRCGQGGLPEDSSLRFEHLFMEGLEPLGSPVKLTMAGLLDPVAPVVDSAVS